jgi:hypothetical protein
LLASLLERAIVVRRGDRERAAASCQRDPATDGAGERDLRVAAAEEAVELRAGAEQVEVDVAQAGKRQRLRDVRIDDDAEGDGADAIGAAGEDAVAVSSGRLPVAGSRDRFRFPFVER